MFDSTRFLIHWNNNEQNSIVEILSLYPIETHMSLRNTIQTLISGAQMLH